MINLCKKKIYSILQFSVVYLHCLLLARNKRTNIWSIQKSSNVKSTTGELMKNLTPKHVFMISRGVLGFWLDRHGTPPYCDVHVLKLHFEILVIKLTVILYFFYHTFEVSLTQNVKASNRKFKTRLGFYIKWHAKQKPS